MTTELEAIIKRIELDCERIACDEDAVKQLWRVFSKAVVKERKAQKMSQADLARLCHVVPSMICHRERADKPWPFGLARKVIAVLTHTNGN